MIISTNIPGSGWHAKKGNGLGNKYEITVLPLCFISENTRPSFSPLYAAYQRLLYHAQSALL